MKIQKLLLNELLQNNSLTGKKILIYGISVYAKRLYNLLKENQIDVVGMVDSYTPNVFDEIKRRTFDYILVEATKPQTMAIIVDTLISQGIDVDTIIYSSCDEDDYLYFEIMKAISDDGFVRRLVSHYLCKACDEMNVKEDVLQLVRSYEWLKYGKNYEEREWHINKQKKIAYLNMAKVACSSISISVKEGIECKRIRREVVMGSQINEASDCYKFTYVRNPFARLVSFYCNKFENRNISRIYEGARYGFTYLKYDEGFETLVNKIVTIPYKWADRHFIPQSELVYDEDGKCVVDYIGKFENLPNDYKFFEDNYSLPALEYHNVQKKEKNWMDYYSVELVEKVYEYYKKDIELFGYESEYIDLLNYCKSKIV